MTGGLIDGLTGFMADVNTLPSAEGSAFGRMFNVLAAPREVFEEIKNREVQNANWIVPAIVSMVIGITVVMILFSQESFMRPMLKAQEKGFDDAVAQGKMSQQAADDMQKKMAGWMPVAMKVIGGVSVAIISFAVPFFWGFVTWLVGVRVFKADFEYMKGVEMSGLATIIYTLAGLIGCLLALSMNRMVGPTPALFLPEIDLANRGHIALSALNVFYFWFAAVIAVSISVLANVSWGKAAAWVLGIWVLIRALLLSNQITAAWVM